MNPFLSSLSALVCCALFWAASVQVCAAADKVSLPDDADQAWEQIQSALSDLRAKAAGAGQDPAAAQRLVREAAGPLADKSLAFIEKFPKDARAPQARQLTVQALSSVASTDPARQEQLDMFVEETLADDSLSDDERAQMYIMKVQLGYMKKLQENPQGAVNAQQEMESIMVEGLLEAARKFPRSQMVYSQLVMLARNKPGDEGRKIAKVIVASEHAPADARKTAQDIIDGKRPYEVGKPLDIKFTAVDGREVDLAKMKGKVVLIDFWATWCGPCVAEIPHVKEVYDKYHAQGFEIIGISFDQDKDALVNFVKEKNLAWPQYFDGKGWQNPYGVKYGIRGIPTMWLLDKNGNLADLNARGSLEQKVQKLLAAQSLQ